MVALQTSGQFGDGALLKWWQLRTAVASSATKTGLPYRYALFFMTDEALLHLLLADRFLHR